MARLRLHIPKLLAIAALASATTVSVAAPAPTKPTPAAAKKPRKPTVVSADHKKKLAENLGGFKFGMSKDDVIAALGKQLDDKYEPEIGATTDIAQQDKLRHDKKEELATLQQSYVQFDGKRTGWDVSVIEDEFVHHTGESMLVRWENSGGKNNRRFFFFFDGKLWKMFISLDVSVLPTDNVSFDAFKAQLTAPSQYGPGDYDPGKITWHTDEFDVRAVDKLKTYGALGVAIEDWKAEKDVLAMRATKAPTATTNNAVINAVVDKDGKDHPDLHSNNDAVNAVINANGGKK